MYYYAALLNKPAACDTLLKGNDTYTKPLCEPCLITYGTQDATPMTTLPTTPPSHKWQSTSDPHVYTTPMLEWTDTPTPGYKPSTKYPGWHWKNRDTEETTPVAQFKAMVNEPTPPPVSELVELPYPVKFYAEEALIMHDELASSSGVVLVDNPANPEGIGKLRLSENPWWYREAYQQGYTSRDSTLSALKQIANRKIDTSKKYAGKLIRIIEARLTELAQTFPEFASQLYGNQAMQSGD